jgi:hypothetical protein
MMRMLWKKQSRHGSIVLEIAIAAPVFLLIGTFILTGISCVRADILLSQSVDQVSQEIAVVLPVVGLGTDLTEKAISLLNDCAAGAELAAPGDKASQDTLKTVAASVGGVDAVLDAFGIDSADLAGTLLFGTIIRDRIAGTYESHCGTDMLLKDRIKNLSVYVDCDYDKHIIWLNVYYEWDTFFGSAEKSITEAIPIYGDITLSLPDTGEVRNGNDEIWMRGNFERGLELRSQFGGNLPASYPVIAKFENGTAVSIKSLDLTAPDYQIPGHVCDKIYEDIDELAGFKGTDAPWGSDGIWIREGEVQNRELLVIIPENCTPEAYNELMACMNYAASNQVTIRIERYGNSYRYADPEEESDSKTA